MLTSAEYIEEGDELSADQAFSETAWYAIDLNGIVAGPFDDVDQCDWWISKAQRVA